MDDHQAGDEAERLRPHPAERAIGESRGFDLGAALQELRAESHPAEKGHRQVTLFHHTPVTHVLFAFEPNGALPDHAAHGLVTIQVIEGRLSVEVDGTNHDLATHQVLVLNPDVRHSVRAAERSAMLLTVHLVGDKAIPHE